MRRFIMIRDIDVSGVSGTGVVLWGIEWPDGRVSYRWHTDPATSVSADSVRDVETIHGHDGATRLVWLDSELTAGRWKHYVRLGDTKRPGTLRGGNVADGSPAR